MVLANRLALLFNYRLLKWKIIFTNICEEVKIWVVTQLYPHQLFQLSSTGNKWIGLNEIFRLNSCNELEAPSDEVDASRGVSRENAVFTPVSPTCQTLKYHTNLVYPSDNKFERNIRFSDNHRRIIRFVLLVRWQLIYSKEMPVKRGIVGGA